MRSKRVQQVPALYCQACQHKTTKQMQQIAAPTSTRLECSNVPNILHLRTTILHLCIFLNGWQLPRGTHGPCHDEVSFQQKLLKAYGQNNLVWGSFWNVNARKNLFKTGYCRPAFICISAGRAFQSLRTQAHEGLFSYCILYKSTCWRNVRENNACFKFHLSGEGFPRPTDKTI